MPGEWSLVSGSEPSRVLLYFHGGGYCSGSIVSHRRMVTEAGRAARCARSRSTTGARPNILILPPTKTRSRLGASCAGKASGVSYRRRWRQRRRQPHARADQPVARGRRGAARLRLAGLALERPDDVGRHARHQGCGRPADPPGLSYRARGSLCAALANAGIR